MINNEIINQIYEKNIEKIEENIQKDYHRRIKKVKEKDEEERNNIKMSIISELYYKQGFKDGVKYMIGLLKKE